MSNGNREFKSDVFSMLMEDKANALSVYNVLNGTNFTDPDELEIHTLEKGVSLTVRNDAAFVVDAALSIYKHQSSVCPNMPVRNLIYYTRSEVVKVTQLDYTFDRQIMLEREDAREEGRAMGLAEGLAEGRAEGRQEGLAEGRAEGRQEGSTKKAKKIAQKMLKANKPLEEIMEFTELSMDELVELAEEITGIGRKEK